MTNATCLLIELATEYSMKAESRTAVALTVLVTLALPLSAHHSGAAECDANKKIDLNGVLTKVQRTNPHAHFYIDVTDASGKVTNWNLELASPNVLVRNGWSR